MQSTPSTIPFRVTTYKLNYHGTFSNRTGLRERVLQDRVTDVWCLQGANISKQLKTLPASFGTYYPSGVAFVHNTERVRLAEKDTVNLVVPLLAAARERPSVADSFCVSCFHFSKLRMFVGLAAYDLVPQPSPSSSPSSSPALLGTQHRVLVVNVDFEKYRWWGSAFQGELVRVLCRLIWEGPRCYTQRWDCTQVCLAGSFFFTPGSPPYRLLTSLSGGLVEELNAQVVVPPFERFTLEENTAGDISAASVRSCVVALAVRGGCRARQLLALQGRSGTADGPLVVLPQLRVFVCGTNSSSSDGGDDERVEGGVADADGWWRLKTPRDTAASDCVVLRLEWDVSAHVTSLCFRVRVRSFGVLTPQRQEADGLRVGQPLLRSAAANTVNADLAAQFREGLRLRTETAADVATLCSDARLAFGEPVVTALYKTTADVPSDCYDYIFVSTFTGAVVQDASRLTITDFNAEPDTPHLPVSCTVALPCEVR